MVLLKDVDKVVKEMVARIKEESENDEDFADDLEDFVMHLDKRMKKLQEKIMELEKKNFDVEHFEHFSSKGNSSLVLRADGIKGKEKFAKLAGMFKKFRKEVEEELKKDQIEHKAQLVHKSDASDLLEEKREEKKQEEKKEENAVAKKEEAPVAKV
ncbi:MAG: hypothetical protein ABIH99_02770 [Candidatus Micrarchaeota archaeon]